MNGPRATIGHVGDSRLYRLTPDGQLRRETEDHSLVEEEVRAGRMTPEQAANHPGRNVISRALGAEQSVEVDMRTIEVESGTTFLLCSDGITRHIPDEELSALLRHSPTLDAACEEFKRVCYERGAEDNLTAVLVRVGEAVRHADTDEEASIIRERPEINAASAEAERVSSHLQRPLDGVAASARADGTDAHVGAESSRAAGNGSDARRSGGFLKGVGVLLLVLAAVGLAFYVGMMFERRGLKRFVSATTEPPPSPAPTAAALEDPEVRFERLRRAVDLSPTTEVIRMTAESNNQPLNSDDPEFLYLYGRAMLLTDRQQEAASAFDRAVQKINENMTPRNGELKIDARLARVAALLRGGDQSAARAASDELSDVIRGQADGANANTQSSPGVNAQPSPGVSP